jgi:hypothetical protein
MATWYVNEAIRLLNIFVLWNVKENEYLHTSLKATSILPFQLFQAFKFFLKNGSTELNAA